ncbi:MAG: hypothetical protein Q8N99_08845 [Nanoarchaeota archaeon]|nr:hypothetical protein [Nanoarchaeota archaeon]
MVFGDFDELAREIGERNADRPDVREGLNLILLQSLKDYADGFELHPSGNRLIKIIDGEEVESLPVSNKIYKSLIYRIEVMADLDPLSKELQRGKIDLNISDERYTFLVKSQSLKDGKYIRVDINYPED